MGTYVCTDLHGKLDLYKKIKEFILPEDIVYFLGDAGDRGPNSWETIKAIYEDPQFIYLKGNHEQMLLDAMQKYFQGDEFGISFAAQVLFNNGGLDTLYSWQQENETDRLNWYNKLQNLNIEAFYTNPKGTTFYMNHSGAGENASEEDKLWDRTHFYETEPSSDCEYIIHGHTPIPIMLEEFAEDGYDDFYTFHKALFYNNKNKTGKKINIDAAAVWKNKVLLLDLDEENVYLLELNEEEVF